MDAKETASRGELVAALRAKDAERRHQLAVMHGGEYPVEMATEFGAIADRLEAEPAKG